MHDLELTEEWVPFSNAIVLAAAFESLVLAHGSLDTLFRPDEAAVMPAASCHARNLARRAIARRGGAAGNIPRRTNGAPLWPPGWVGSLSHDAGHAAALVGRAEDFRALGVDIEPDEPLPADAATLVIGAREAAALAALPGGYARWSRALFGAKECVHKCVNPLSGAWLEFDEVEVHIDAGREAFRVEALSTSAKRAIVGITEGRIRRMGGCIVTALAVPV